jgi:hypothetical protein
MVEIRLGLCFLATENKSFGMVFLRIFIVCQEDRAKLMPINKKILLFQLLKHPELQRYFDRFKNLFQHRYILRVEQLWLILDEKAN